MTTSSAFIVSPESDSEPIIILDTFEAVQPALDELASRLGFASAAWSGTHVIGYTNDRRHGGELIARARKVMVV